MVKFSENVVFNARYIAYYAHLQQVDHGGNPYIFHLVAVAEKCTSLKRRLQDTYMIYWKTQTQQLRIC